MSVPEGELKKQHAIINGLANIYKIDLSRLKAGGKHMLVMQRSSNWIAYLPFFKAKDGKFYFIKRKPEVELIYRRKTDGFKKEFPHVVNIEDFNVANPDTTLLKLQKADYASLRKETKEVKKEVKEEVKEETKEGLTKEELHEASMPSLSAQKKRKAFQDALGFMKAEGGIYHLYTEKMQFVLGGDTVDSLLEEFYGTSAYSEGNEFLIISLRYDDAGIVIESRVFVANDKLELVMKRQFERLVEWSYIHEHGFGLKDIRGMVKDTFNAKVKEDVSDVKLTKIGRVSRADLASMKRYARKKYAKKRKH